MLKVLICDLDGSLMNPSSGLYVKEEIKNKLIQLQEKGFLVILNSARVFQGVYPLALQIRMDVFGGFVISSNGAHVYDVKKKETVFDYPIDFDTCETLWELTLQHHLEPGYTQPDHCVCHFFTHGYELDAFNCGVEYRVKENCAFSGSVCKFSVSDTKEKMDVYFDELKKAMESQCEVLAIRSTPYMADVISSCVDKYKTCDRLLKLLHLSWDHVSCIGDGTSDLECVKAAKLGVTLENGKDSLKAIADVIVPSCFEDGCVQWLDDLLYKDLN